MAVLLRGNSGLSSLEGIYSSIGARNQTHMLSVIEVQGAKCRLYEIQRAVQWISITVPALPMAAVSTFAEGVIVISHIPGQSKLD